MHPILARLSRLAVYLLAWGLLSALMVMALVPRVGSAPAAALLLFPPSFVYAFICLASWYAVRATPAGTTPPLRLATTHAIAAVVSSAVWVAIALAWSKAVENASTLAAPSQAFRGELRYLFGIGVALYLLAVAVHSLILAMEMSREVESRRLELQVLGREAELKALRDQVNPHFLFNSLNSISALCGSNPSSARTMAIVLSEFLRKSLKVGNEDLISLSDEIELANSYLAVERIRFGSRLELEQDVDESARACRLPPLLIQPLVENAVTHGISSLVEGGTVRLEARMSGGRLRIVVENGCDAERVRRPGSGLGLRNVGTRIERTYGSEGSFEVTELPGRFRVAITIPAE